MLPTWQFANSIIRRRHIKCDEKRPTCGRCARGGRGCQYPTLRDQARQTLVLQPSASIQPAGDGRVAVEIDLFGSFRTAIVASIGGPFNGMFWRVDVPTAAQQYPSLWHSAIALAAIHHSAKLDKARIRQAGLERTQSPNRYYLLALVHYNKSIRFVADALAGLSLENLTYAHKEMIIMNNILYMGICSMLEDDSQRASHIINFIGLLEKMRFGEEAPSNRHGIMRYEDLLAVVLAIDGSLDETDKYTDRRRRAWAVAVPEHSSIESATQAYIGALPFIYYTLTPEFWHSKNSYQGPTLQIGRKRALQSYQERLDIFEHSTKNITKMDRQALEMIRLHLLCFKLKDALLRVATRDDVLKHDAKWFDLLDQIENVQSRTTSLDRPYSHEIPPITFAPSVGRALEAVASFAPNAKARYRAIDLMRKWPFKENNVRSEEESAGYEALIKFDLEGPQRTKRWQQQGIPIRPTFKNGGLTEGEFDGCKGCECIYGRYVCRDHKLGQYEKNTATTPPQIGLQCCYERRNNLPYTWYPLHY